MSSRRVGAMRLWASNHTEEVMKEAGTSDIGPRSHAAAQMWRQLPLEDKAPWEARAAEHTKDSEDQCFLYVQTA